MSPNPEPGYKLHPWPWPDAANRHTPAELAERVGVCRKTLERWRQRGRLTTDQADRLAVRGLGVTPHALWPWWSDDDVRAIFDELRAARA